MTQFSGKFSHKLDNKGKVSIPNKFRMELDQSVVLTQGVDGNYIELFPMEEWKVWLDQLVKLPKSKTRQIRRHVVGPAHEVTIDKVGRIQIPQALREYAGIDNSAVYIVGMVNTIEIWNKETLEQAEAQSIQENNISNLMEELGI